MKKIGLLLLMMIFVGCIFNSTEEKVPLTEYDAQVVVTPNSQKFSDGFKEELLRLYLSSNPLPRDIFLTKDDSFIYIKQYYKDRGYYSVYNTDSTSDTLYYIEGCYDALTGKDVKYNEKHSLKKENYNFDLKYINVDTVINNISSFDTIIYDSYEHKGKMYFLLSDSSKICFDVVANAINIKKTYHVLKNNKVIYKFSTINDIYGAYVTIYKRDNNGLLSKIIVYQTPNITIPNGGGKSLIKTIDTVVEDISFYKNFTMSEQFILENYYISSGLMKHEYIE